MAVFFLTKGEKPGSTCDILAQRILSLKLGAVVWEPYRPVPVLRVRNPYREDEEYRGMEEIRKAFPEIGTERGFFHAMCLKAFRDALEQCIRSGHSQEEIMATVESALLCR